MHSVGILADNGRLLTLFSGRKVRGFPADVGNCMVGMIQACPIHVLEEVKKITSELGYTGIAEFEYKIDSSTGHYRLIEINPRTWSWIGITRFIEGCDLVQNAYKHFLLRVDVVYRDSLNEKNHSIRFISLYEDLLNNIFIYDKNISFKIGFITWVKEFTKQKNVIQDFFEIKIAFIQTVRFVKSFIKLTVSKFLDSKMY